ncbi:hypothetical protein L2E82_02028 [Cichorium intybus]|uniref:Uncharacterized protein n=1 Tax=Cichorium intybus TaxID=13427 RepID=A0ACB9H1T3_CICIN|nr:hypothetical protein L2E82_02028 [Cichorium intybus]
MFRLDGNSSLFNGSSNLSKGRVLALRNSFRKTVLLLIRFGGDYASESQDRSNRSQVFRVIYFTYTVFTISQMSSGYSNCKEKLAYALLELFSADNISLLFKLLIIIETCIVDCRGKPTKSVYPKAVR